MWNFKTFGAVVALVAAVLSAPAKAVTVKYTATDLTDVVVGQDRWSIDYLVSGSFVGFGGLNVVYSYAEFANLVATTSPDPLVWTVNVTDPDPGLFADGLVSLSPSADITVIDLLFSVEFTWLGTGSPGSQAFEVFDDLFAVVGNGQTAQAGVTDPNNSVPEPGTLLMVASALLLLALSRSRRGAQAASGIRA